MSEASSPPPSPGLVCCANTVCLQVLPAAELENLTRDVCFYVCALCVCLCEHVVCMCCILITPRMSIGVLKELTGHEVLELLDLYSVELRINVFDRPAQGESLLTAHQDVRGGSGKHIFPDHTIVGTYYGTMNEDELVCFVAPDEVQKDNLAQVRLSAFRSAFNET